MTDDNEIKGSGRRGSRARTIDLAADEYAARDQSAQEQGGETDAGEAAREALFTPPATDAATGETAGAPMAESAPAHDAPSDPSGTAEAAAGAAEPDAGAFEPAGEAADPAPAAAVTPVAPASKTRGGFMPALAAAVAGGLVVLAGLAGLGSAGVSLPGLGGAPGAGVSANGDVEALRSQLAALKAEVAEMAPAADSGRLDALEQRLVAAEEAQKQLRDALAALPAGAAQGPAGEAGRGIDELAGRLAAAEAELTALKAAPAAGGAESGALQALEQKLGGDIAALGGRVGSAQSAAETSAAEVAQFDARLDGLEGSIAQIRTLAEELKAARENANTEGETLARTVAANALRTAYDKGEGFAGLLASARTLTGENEATAALDRHASNGVPTLAALGEALRGASADALAALAPKEEGVVAQLLSSARSLVKVKPAGPQPGNSPEAVLSRVEAAVAAGDPAAALAEWRSLPEPAQAAATGFGDMLATRVEADAAIARVLEALAAANRG